MAAPPLKIAAVFATMDRKATAAGCVRALAAQSRAPDLVVVADNVSSDGTAEHLEGMDALPFDFRVHRMSENRGNAGGVEAAMEIAFAAGVDAVWILDDDSWPRAGALEAMLLEPWNPGVVMHPLQLDPRSGRLTWPMFIRGACGRWILIDIPEHLPPGKCTPSRIAWTGALVPRQVRDAVGPVNGALFIRGEDEEYPWRIEQAGFTFMAVHDAILDHPGPQHVVHWKFMGRNFFFERGLADWKLYYKVRNMVWLKRRQSGAFKAIRMALAYLAAAVLFDGMDKLPVLRRAVADGWRGRLGPMPRKP